MTFSEYLAENYDELKGAASRIAGSDGDDLLHEVILQLYDSKPETIKGLIAKGDLKFWVLRVMLNNYNSSTSRYHYKWRKDAERVRKFSEQVRAWSTVNGSAAKREQLMTHIEQKLAGLEWFDAEIFAIYFEEQHSLNSLSEATGISRHTLYSAIRRAKKEIQGSGGPDSESDESHGDR